MAKENAFYFSHDYNARNDDKIKKLIMKHGLLGYGIYWAIIEDLYNNANALRTDYECISFDLRTDINTIKSIINDFDLFVFEDNVFGSLSVQRRLDERNAKSLKARESAVERWKKYERNANALQTQYGGNAIKESKGKEIKEIKEKELIPEFSEFLQYAKTLEIYNVDLDFSIKAKYESWVENKWKDGNNKKILNWKTKLKNTMPFLRKVEKPQEPKKETGLAYSKEF